MVKEVVDGTEFMNIVKTYPKNLIVVDFFADWCGPCKMIAPEIERMENEYRNVIFLKVNVDKSDEICSMLEVSSLPTFYYIKNGNPIDKSIGAAPDVIRQKIMIHSK